MNEWDVTKSASLSDELRAWLRERKERPEVIATALVYELSALLAHDAPTAKAAITLVDHWTNVMKQQIIRLGVNKEHP